MTFTLQEYAELKRKFNDTKIAVLESHGLNPDEIEKLPTDRKEPIRFIEYLMTTIDEQVAQIKLAKRTKAIPASSQSEVLNAAIHLMSIIITENLSIYRASYYSLTRDRFRTDLGITADQQPSDHQYFTIYRRLNHFLKIIFTNTDSRLGINNEHPLRFIRPETLTTYIKKSYALEEEYYNKSMSAVVSDASGREVAEDYKVVEPVPPEALRDIPSWDELKAQFHALKLREEGKKRVSRILDLPNAERVAQYLFLIAIRDNLDTASIKEEEKRAIFSGAMYVVLGQINQNTYKVSPLSKTAQASITHTGLTEILSARTSTPQTVYDLVTSAHNYMTHMTRDGVKLRSRHLFSDIPTFSLVDVFALCKNMTKLARDCSLDLAMATYKEEQEKLASEKTAREEAVREKAKESAGGFMSMLGLVGGLFHSISAAAPKPTDTAVVTEDASVGVVTKDDDYETHVKSAVGSASPR